jgi:hypothetical protein
MNNVQQAIRDAAEKASTDIGGGKWTIGYNGLQLRALSEHLQDPDFWKALSTARKWEDVNAWRFHWHRFIDHLADGKERTWVHFVMGNLGGEIQRYMASAIP